MAAALALTLIGAVLGTATVVVAWSHGYASGQADGRREADQHKATALGWMKAAIAAERRADEAEALLALDYDVRGTL